MPHRDSHAAAAVCFCGQIRTLPALAPRLRTHVLEAMQSPVDSFLSLSVDTGQSLKSLSTVMDIIRPKRAVLYGDPPAHACDAWLNLLPHGRTRLHPASAVREGLAPGVPYSRCGMGLVGAMSFYSNFVKISACFVEVEREESLRSSMAGIAAARYGFVITMRADIWFAQPLPPLTSFSTRTIGVPFCNPLEEKRVKTGRCGGRVGGDAIGRGRSTCDVATDWMAIVPRQHASTYFSAFTKLHHNTTCAQFLEANRAMCHCHGDVIAQECMLSQHLAANQAPYERVEIGALAIGRSVTEVAMQPAKPKVRTNILIAANGVNSAHCLPTASRHFSPCPEMCSTSRGSTFFECVG